MAHAAYVLLAFQERELIDVHWASLPNNGSRLRRFLVPLCASRDAGLSETAIELMLTSLMLVRQYI